MRYLLDTNVVSDFVRGDPRVSARLRSTRPEELAVSTITVMELDYGLALSPKAAKRLGRLIDSILESVSVLPFSREDARAAGVVRASLRKRGLPVGPYDVLLAGCALARGLTLVTANRAEFGRITGLTTDDWH